MKLFLKKLLMIYGLCAALLISICFIYPMALLSKILPNGIYLLHRAWRPYCLSIMRFSLFSPLTIIDERKDKSHCPKNVLIISNHQSLIDIPLIHTSIAARPLMKAEILKVPIFGFVSSSSGAISVKRGDAKSRKEAFKKCIKVLTDGLALIYYPEGTRSKLGRPKDFKDIHKPLMIQAYKLGVPILPLSHYGTQKVFRKKMLELGVPLGLKLGKEIDPKDFSTEEEFLTYSWKQVQDGFDQLKTLLS